MYRRNVCIREEDVKRDGRIRKRSHLMPDWERKSIRENHVPRSDSSIRGRKEEEDVERRWEDGRRETVPRKTSRRWDEEDGFRSRSITKRRRKDRVEEEEEDRFPRWDPYPCPTQQQGERRRDVTKLRQKRNHHDSEKECFPSNTSLLRLPEDLILRILMKIDIAHLIFTLPLVSSSCYKLSKNPLLYRSIVIAAGNDTPFLYNTPYRNLAKYKPKALLKSVKLAVDRSCGNLVEFSCTNMRNFNIPDIRYIIATCMNTLKSLRLGMCIDVHNARQIIDLVKNIHSLEELYLTDDSVTAEGIKQIGSGCPKLKFFSLGTFKFNCQERALAIAHTMPSLQRLSLYGNGLTDTTVEAILKGCPSLHYFYIKGFSNFQAHLLTTNCADRINSIQILAEDAQEFGHKYEFHLKPSIDTQEQVGDHGFGDYTLSLFNAPFKDIEVLRIVD